jgi:hypothetical protein
MSFEARGLHSIYSTLISGSIKLIEEGMHSV